jgi:hypothetical protein
MYRTPAAFAPGCDAIEVLLRKGNLKAEFLTFSSNNLRISSTDSDGGRANEHELIDPPPVGAG